MKNLDAFLSKLPSSCISQEKSVLESYTVDNPVIDSAAIPAAVLSPIDTATLEKIIDLANALNIAIVTVSSDAPHQKGGTACSSPHVIVDLSHKKEIFDADRRNRVCRVEAGVTYDELNAALEKHKLVMPTTLAPRKGKSILAAVMDREPMTWANKQWDISDPVGSTEFIFGSGQLFRTGAAGSPGSLQRQKDAGGAQKCSSGPSQTDFHRVIQAAQGTMGVINWITLRCEVKPSIETSYLIGCDQLEPLLALSYEVQRPWLGEHSFILNRQTVAMLLSHKHSSDSDDNNTDDKIANYNKIINDLPKYLVLQNIAGFDTLPKERIKYQTADISNIAKKHDLTLIKKIGCVSAEQLLEASRTHSGKNGWRRNKTGDALAIGFQSTLKRSPEFIKLFEDELALSDLGKTLKEDSLAIYLQPQVQNHQCHIEFVLPFDANNSKEVEGIKQVDKRITEVLLSAGAFFSRPYGEHQSKIFQKNPSNLKLLKQIKTIFDPKAILNPNKWGIAPDATPQQEEIA